MTNGIGNNVAGERLQSYVTRVERIQEEIDASNADKRGIFAEAKGEGFNVKTLKKLIKERRVDPGERKEQGDLFDLYWDAIDRLGETGGAATGEVTETGETTEPGSGEVEGGASPEDAAAAGTPPEAPTASSGGEPTREEDDATEEPMPEQPAIEEDTAAPKEKEPEGQETPVAPPTWTCAGCGWVGMSAMVTDECPDCGASAGGGVLAEDDGMPDFLNRKGELPG